MKNLNPLKAITGTLIMLLLVACNNADAIDMDAELTDLYDEFSFNAPHMNGQGHDVNAAMELYNEIGFTSPAMLWDEQNLDVANAALKPVVDSLEIGPVDTENVEDESSDPNEQSSEAEAIAKSLDRE